MPLRYVDPHKKQSRWYTALNNFGRSRPGQALQQANVRCEAVICLLSKKWEASRECQTEFRYAENLGRTMLCARLEPVPRNGRDVTTSTTSLRTFPRREVSEYARGSQLAFRSRNVSGW